MVLPLPLVPLTPTNERQLNSTKTCVLYLCRETCVMLLSFLFSLWFHKRQLSGAVYIPVCTLMTQSCANAFSERSAEICSAFFASDDLNDKSWLDLHSLATADAVTFWTVVTRHSSLPRILSSAFSKVDEAIHSTSIAVKKSISKKQVKALTGVALRLCNSEECVMRRVDPGSLSSHIVKLIPLKHWVLLNEVLLQMNGSFASLTGYCMHFLSPSYFLGYANFILEWRESIDCVAKRCSVELSRGRYQRLSGDVLLMFERVYRAVKQVSSILQSCPFAADYLPISHVMRGLRIIVDILSPLLQHFFMTCEALTSRREMLSRANAAMVNACISSATSLILFRGFSCGDATRLEFLVPSLPKKLDEHVAEYVELYVRGYPLDVFMQWAGKQRSQRGKRGGLHGLFDALCPSILVEKTRSLGDVWIALMNPLAESSDFISAAPPRQRFFELLLVEQVNQGVHIDELLHRGFITPTEAEQLGASQQTVLCAMEGISLVDEVAARGGDGNGSSAAAASITESSSRPPAAPSNVCEPGSFGAIVQEVFPHFSVIGITAALQHYQNDIEQLINDASCDNLPPHLVDLLSTEVDAVNDEPCEPPCTAPSPPPLSVPEANSAGAVTHLSRADYEEEAGIVSYTQFSFLLGDDVEEMSESNYASGGAGEEEVVDYVSFAQQPIDASSSAFHVSDEMKERIRILNEVVYEDEYDDGQQTGQYAWNANHAIQHDNDDNDEEDEESTEAAAAQEEGVPPRQGMYATRTFPRSDYEVKRFNVKREKQSKSAAQPSYIKKETSRKVARKAGKADAARLVKQL